MSSDIWYREYLAVAAQLDAMTQERDELRAELADADAYNRQLVETNKSFASLIGERDELREFIEDIRMQAVHAASADLTLANEYIIARIDAALKEETTVSDEDLVTRLRYNCDVMGDWLCGDAADEIERLRAELAAQRVGLATKHQQYVEANEARIDANGALGSIRGLLWDVDEELAGGGHLRDGRLRRRVHSAIKNIGKLLEDGEQYE